MGRSRWDRFTGGRAAGSGCAWRRETVRPDDSPATTIRGVSLQPGTACIISGRFLWQPDVYERLATAARLAPERLSAHRERRRAAHPARHLLARGRGDGAQDQAPPGDRRGDRAPPEAAPCRGARRARRHGRARPDRLVPPRRQPTSTRSSRSSSASTSSSSSTADQGARRPVRGVRADALRTLGGTGPALARVVPVNTRVEAHAQILPHEDLQRMLGEGEVVPGRPVHLPEGEGARGAPVHATRRRRACRSRARRTPGTTCRRGGGAITREEAAARARRRRARGAGALHLQHERTTRSSSATAARAAAASCAG